MSAEHAHLPPGVEVVSTLPEAGARIPAEAEARTIRVTLAPGDPGAPPHRHPGPVFGYVTQGEILFELEGQQPRVLKAGDALFEPGGDVIHYQGANNLPDAQSQLVVTMFAPPGTPVLTVVGEEELAERRHLRYPHIKQADHSGKADVRGITTLESLREHLQWAIELEHATLPPYLTALYSLDPQRNTQAVELLGSVFVEEMIHLALAANLLNAVGGRPRIDTPQMLAPYPRPVPHADPAMELSLLPFGKEALEMFLRLEQPAHPGDPGESDNYETIGQFYDAVESGLRRLCAELGEEKVFVGDPARQVAAGPFGHTGGKLSPVTDLATALAALEEIVEQGEGAARTDVWDGDMDMFHPHTKAVSHYYRFQELAAGRRFQAGDTPGTGPTGEEVAVDPAGVYPVRPNPRLGDHPVGSEIRTAQEAFNETYCEVLEFLEHAFNGEPEMLKMSVRAMYALKKSAQTLMAMPDGEGLRAGPTFDYVRPEDRR